MMAKDALETWTINDGPYKGEKIVVIGPKKVLDYLDEKRNGEK